MAPWAGCWAVEARERDRSSNKLYFFNIKQYKNRWPTAAQFFPTRDRSRPRQAARGRALRVRATGRQIPFSIPK